MYHARRDVTLPLRDGIRRKTFARGEPVDLELLSDEVRADPAGHELIEDDDEEAE
jgi:hypothetical protein